MVRNTVQVRRHTPKDPSKIPEGARTPSGRLHNYFSLFLGLLLISLLMDTSITQAVAADESSPAPPSKRTEKNQDIVFIVDVSSSMRNIFEDVRGAILGYALQARPGDNIVLISFGEKVELRFRHKIRSQNDTEAIERELRELEPNQYYTYITAALDKGLEELRLLEKKDPTHLRTMVLMSDGKNNPPENVANPVKFEELLEKYPVFFGSPDSAFFYLSLGRDPDPEVITLMHSFEGASFDLKDDVEQIVEQKRQLELAQIFVEPVSIDLGTVLGPKATATVSLAFFPARGNPSEKAISAAASAHFRENPSLSTILEIYPAAFNCSDKPWSREFQIRVESFQEGILVGALELKPLPGQVLFIDPPEIPITMTIRQPKMDVVVDGKLEFGPIDPRSKFRESQIVALIPNEAATDEEIQATSDLLLPEGLTLETNIQKREKTLQLVITVATDENFKPSHSATLEGAIHLSGVKRVVDFSKSLVKIQISVSPPSARSRIITGVFTWLNRTLVLIFIVIVSVLLIGLAAFWLVKERPQSALEGKLVLVNLKDESFDSSRVITANLKSLGKSLGRDLLTIGSAKDAGITIPHKSVAPQHCQLYVRMDEDHKRIYIEPLGKNSIIVNLQVVNEPTPLSDRDIIEIGAYTFRFENPRPYKQLVVKYVDGRIVKGTPASWDIDSSGFNLLPRDALPGSREEIYVPFSELKAVYFVRDFDGHIGRKIVSPATQIQGTHVRISFHDGERIDGYTSENYSSSSPRFYFFPADQTGNTISMVVERQHLQNIEILQVASQPDADNIASAADEASTLS